VEGVVDSGIRCAGDDASPCLADGLNGDDIEGRGVDGVFVVLVEGSGLKSFDDVI